MSLLVKRWHKKLCRHAHWYIKDPEIAKDLVQDSWGIIIRKIGTLRQPDRFGSWALSIVTRKSIDWLRRHKTEINTLKNYYDSNNHIGNDDRNDPNLLVLIEMKKLISELPSGQRMVLNLFYLEELSIKQISESLLISEGTVKSRLFNAREKLRITLKSKNYEK